MHVLAVKETPLGTVELIKVVRGKSMFTSFEDLPHGTLNIIDDHAQKHSVEVRVRSNGEAPQKFDRKVMRGVLEGHFANMIDETLASLIPAGRGLHDYTLNLNGEEKGTHGEGLEHQFQLAYSRNNFYPYVSIRFYPGRDEAVASAAVSVTLKSGISIQFGTKIGMPGHVYNSPIVGTGEILGQELPFTVQYKAWPQFHRFISREAIVEALEEARNATPILHPMSGWQGGMKSWQFHHDDPVVG